MDAQTYKRPWSALKAQGKSIQATPTLRGLIKNRGGKTLLKYALVPAVKQAKRTNVGSGVARRRVGLAGILSMALVAGVLMSASSAFASPKPLLVLTNYTASDTGVTYSVAFVTPSELTQGSAKVTLLAPDGTTFGNCKPEACKVSIEPAGGGAVKSGSATKASVSEEGNQVKITMPVTARPGDRVIVHIPGGTNSSSTGLQKAVLSTSADKTGVSIPFDISPRVLISQVRPGANESFVELYAGGQKVNLKGWTLKEIEPGGAATTLVAFEKQLINNNAEQPNGFLLAAGPGYSTGPLNAYAPADVTYSSSIPANGAVALYDKTGALVDSVVFGAGTGLESNGYLGTYSNSNEEYAFVRKLDQQPEGRTGAPLYTGHNASDWTLVAPEASDPLTEASPVGTGSSSALTAFEGAPGPHDLSSQAIQNPNITVSLLKGTEANAAPNFQLVKSPASPHTSETLFLRRTITYHGQCTLGNIRLRVSEITTDSNPAPAPSAKQAILRVLGNEESGFTFDSQTYPLAQTVLDNGGTDGGGLNSSLSLPGTNLATGQSVNVAIRLSVQQSGNYRFYFNVEGSPTGFCS